MNKYEEALEVCQGLYDYRGNSYVRPYEMDSTTLDTIKDLVEKEEKYKWHDLRKDPKDLPRPLSMNLYVLADWNPYCLNKYGLLDFSRDGEWCIEDTILDDINVIAWKYLEDFEDE